VFSDDAADVRVRVVFIEPFTPAAGWRAKFQEDKLVIVFGLRQTGLHQFARCSRRLRCGFIASDDSWGNKDKDPDR